MNNIQPKKEHKFSFGLWTVGNPGRDPFGEPTRQPISPINIVKRLSEIGAYGVNFHDNDLVPIDAGAAERAAVQAIRAKAAEAAAKAAATIIAQKHDAGADKALVDKTIAGLGRFN